MFKITGNVQIAGATIFYAGTANGTVMSDSQGNYVIPNLSNGTYTITPSLEGHSFIPSNQTATILGADVVVNFQDPVTYSGSWLTVTMDNMLRGSRSH